MDRTTQGRAVLTGIVLAAWMAGSGIWADEIGSVQPAWETSLSLGLHATDGNSETVQANVGVSSEYRRRAHELRLGLEGSYGEAKVDVDGLREDQTTTQNARAGANYKYRFNGSYVYLDTALLHDSIADIRYRLTSGPGVGYRLVETSRLRLDGEVGATYIREELRNQPRDGAAAADETDDGLAFRLAERFEYRLNAAVRFWQSAEYLPSADDLEEFLLTVEVGLESALNERSSLRTVIQDKYDSRPAFGREKNDLTVIASVVVRL